MLGLSLEIYSPEKTSELITSCEDYHKKLQIECDRTASGGGCLLGTIIDTTLVVSNTIEYYQNYIDKKLVIQQSMDDDEPLIIFPDISSSNGYSKTNSEPILQIETIDLFDPFKKVKNNTILPINQSTSAELTNNPSSDLNASKKPHQNNILEMDFFNQ